MEKREEKVGRQRIEETRFVRAFRGSAGWNYCRRLSRRGYRQQVAGRDTTDPLLVNDQRRFRGTNGLEMVVVRVR